MPNKKIIINISLLTGMQLVTYILPFLIIPYTTRVLGLEIWGKVIFFQILFTFGGLITNWGFQYSATKRIANNIESLEKLSEIFVSTWIAQFFIFIGVLVIGLVGIYFYGNMLSDIDYIIYGIFILLANLLFPTWLFNGLERMLEMVIMQLAGKVIVLPLFFIIIKNPEDGPLVIFLNIISSLISGVLATYWIFKIQKLNVRIPKISEIFKVLGQGRLMFGSIVWVNLYTSLIPIILGIAIGPSAVGIYSLADRIRNVPQALLQPITQAMYPKICKIYTKENKIPFNLIAKFSGLSALLSAIAGLILWIFSDELVMIIGGGAFSGAAEVLKWMSFLPLIVSISNIFGTQILIPSHNEYFVYKAVKIGAIFSMIATYPLIMMWESNGAAIALLISEIIVTIGVVYFSMKLNLKLKTKTRI